MQLSFDLLNISGISKVNSYSLIVYNLQQQYGEYFNESMISEEVRKQFIGTNYARIIININSAEESAESFETINEINGVLEEAFEGKTYIIGVTASALEIKNYTVKDYELVSILTILFIGIILLITFRSLLIPIILVAAIQSAFWMNMAIPYLLNQPIIFIGYIIVSCIQMGATIDYAILYTENYLNNRKNNDILTSVKIAFKSSQSVIIVSAGILAATGFILGLTSNLAATVVIGLALGRGALTSFLIVSILLPQLLIIFDKPIALTTLKLRKRKKLI